MKEYDEGITVQDDHGKDQRFPADMAERYEELMTMMKRHEADEPCNRRDCVDALAEAQDAIEQGVASLRVIERAEQAERAWAEARGECERANAAMDNLARKLTQAEAECERLRGVLDASRRTNQRVLVAHDAACQRAEQAERLRDEAIEAADTTAPGRLWLAQRRKHSAEIETAVAPWRERARTLETICEGIDADRQKLREMIDRLTQSNKMKHRQKIIADLQQAEAALAAAKAMFRSPLCRDEQCVFGRPDKPLTNSGCICNAHRPARQGGEEPCSECRATISVLVGAAESDIEIYQHLCGKCRARQGGE